MNNNQTWAVGMLLVTFGVFRAFLGSGLGTGADPLVAGAVLIAGMGICDSIDKLRKASEGRQKPVQEEVDKPEE